jgi:predicted DNA-binding protein
VVSSWYHYAMAMTLRLSNELDRKITAHALRIGMSKQKFVIHAIEAQLERDAQASVAQAVVDKVLVRDKKLLDRLSTS